MALNFFKNQGSDKLPEISDNFEKLESVKPLMPLKQEIRPVEAE